MIQGDAASVTIDAGILEINMPLVSLGSLFEIPFLIWGTSPLFKISLGVLGRDVRIYTMHRCQAGMQWAWLWCCDVKWWHELTRAGRLGRKDGNQVFPFLLGRTSLVQPCSTDNVRPRSTMTWQMSIPTPFFFLCGMLRSWAFQSLFLGPRNFAVLAGHPASSQVGWASKSPGRLELLWRTQPRQHFWEAESEETQGTCNCTPQENSAAHWWHAQAQSSSNISFIFFYKIN